MSDKRELDPREIAMYEGNLTKQLSVMVERLREMTAQIERQSKHVPELRKPLRGETASEIAGNIVHMLAWGNANLNVSQFVRSAAEFDREVLG